MTPGSNQNRLNDNVGTIVAICSAILASIALVTSYNISTANYEHQKKLAQFNAILEFNKQYNALHIDFRKKIDKDNGKEYLAYDFYRQHWGLEGSAFLAWYIEGLIPDEIYALWVISQKADYKRNTLKIKGTSYRDGYKDIKNRYLSLVKRSEFYDFMDVVFGIKPITILNDSFYSKEQREKLLKILDFIKEKESGQPLEESSSTNYSAPLPSASSSASPSNSPQTPSVKSSP